MSRTDKDRPYWVAAGWWEPQHVRCSNAVHSWLFAAQGRLRDCDLPDLPDGKRPVLRTWLTGRCSWKPVWHSIPRHIRYQQRSHPPRWLIQHLYHDPQRALVRDTLRAAAADWRAHGDTDIEPEPIQARGSARYDYY